MTVDNKALNNPIAPGDDLAERTAEIFTEILTGEIELFSEHACRVMRGGDDAPS